MNDLTSCQSKLIQVDEKIHNLWKSDEDMKFKEIKLTADLREMSMKVNENVNLHTKVKERFIELDKIN